MQELAAWQVLALRTPLFTSSLKTQELALRTVLLVSSLNAQCSEGVVVHVCFVIIVRDVQMVAWLFACIFF